MELKLTRRLIPFAALLVTPAAPAAPALVDARDWPCEIVRTAASLYLKGRPKDMSGLGNQGIPQLTYRFYPDGVVKLYESSPGGFEETRYKRGRLLQMRQGNSHDEGGTSTYYTPRILDARGRVTALLGISHADDGVRMNLGNGDMAVLVTYGDGYQIKETHFRVQGKVGTVLRERFEFAPEGWLTQKCPLPPGQDHCSADAVKGWSFGRTLYGPFGPLRHENRQIVTVYTYEDGELATETRTDAGETPQQYTLRYGHYRHDACDNWIERQVTAEVKDQVVESWKETRAFTYYEACPAPPAP